VADISDDADGTTRIGRRTYLAAVGGVGAAALAGCSGGGGDGGDGGSAPEEVSNYLGGAGNFDGSVEDMTGSDEVTVKVGASGNNNWSFGPAAVRVSTGTTVVWEWTGKGGSHNVVAESGDWESKLVGSPGNTFEQTFDSPGTVEYFCRPHKASGMKGVVVVGETSESGGGDA
jgi:halocyanin-like protein